MLVTLVKTKQDCLKKLLKTIGTTRRRAGSLSSSGGQFQTIKPAIENARPICVELETTARYNELLTVWKYEFNNCEEQQQALGL